MDTQHRLAESSRLWQELLSQNPTNDDLGMIVMRQEPLQVRAAMKLLDRMPTNPHLCAIIEHVPVLRVAAAQKLITRKPSNDELRHIMRHVKTLALYTQAERMLTKRPAGVILQDILGGLARQQHA